MPVLHNYQEAEAAPAIADELSSEHSEAEVADDVEESDGALTIPRIARIIFLHPVEGDASDAGEGVDEEAGEYYP